jgi:exodeoxyribonuclease VII large subunit
MASIERKGERDEPAERVLRVVELNRIAKRALEQGFPDVWVEGELSDVVRAASGHLYFTLNDGQDPAQLRCVMFRGEARRSRAKFANGEKVRLRGGLTLYEARGSYQLIAKLALPAGEGDLHAELARLREKLAKEGLFDPARKRALPRVPQVVGVVTSTAGAAVHDIIEVARARCPVRIVVANCLVQGVEAPGSIVRALVAIQKLPELDVVIVGRGGGGAEDLVAFQDERVARAIAACRVPVVSAVGHEVDVTIADLVADVRAATPSNAAELVVPERRVLLGELENKVRGMERAFDGRLDRARARLEKLARRLARQDARVRLGRDRGRLAALTLRLRRADARAQLAKTRQRVEALDGRLTRAAEALVERRRKKLAQADTQLRALSPLRVLERGYAIALSEETGRALVHAGDVAPGALVRVRLARGSLDARVETVHAAPEKASEE